MLPLKFQQAANQIGQTVTKFLNERNQENINDFTHPATGIHLDVHFDPNEIEHAVAEGLKHPKIAGVP
jgi:hypothetical protein